MQRDYSLEAIRGFAALMVVMWHLVLGFAPHRTLMFGGETGGHIQDSVLFVFMNGGSAVVLFFVLSGYVLTLRYARTRNMSGLVSAAMKRWPRLVGPVLIATLLSAALFQLGAYHYAEAGELIQSPWLTRFGYADPQLSLTTDTLASAVYQGAWGTFFDGDVRFNSALWTMPYEIWGSLLVLALAPILFDCLDRSFKAAGAFLAFASAAAFIKDPIYVSFIAGLALHVILPRVPSLPLLSSAILLGISIYCLGYSGYNAGAYAPMAYSPVWFPSTTAMHLLGSICLIVAVKSSPFFCRALSGRVAHFLGEISFPIYLMHMLVIGSIGSYLLIKTGSPKSAFFASFLCSIIASIPLLIINNGWISLLNRITRLKIRKDKVAPPVLGCFPSR